MISQPWNSTARNPDARARLYDATMEVLSQTIGTDMRATLPKVAMN